MDSKRPRKSGPSPRAYAMNLLARREYSFAELKEKLRRRFDNDESAEALTRLRDENLQSDERFARSFARERMLRGHGPQRIDRDLNQRRVASELIDAALSGVPAEEGTTWASLAREALFKKFPSARDILDPGSGNHPEVAELEAAEKARWMRFLSYRGFSSQIGDVLRGD